MTVTLSLEVEAVSSVGPNIFTSALMMLAMADLMLIGRSTLDVDLPLYPIISLKQEFIYEARFRLVFFF